MGIQARNVVRKARKLGHTFVRGSYDTCAVGFLAQTVNNEYASDLGVTAQFLGVKGAPDRQYGILRAIERGFEDITHNAVGCRCSCGQTEGDRAFP